MSTVYLIRHGEIVGRSKKHRFIGRLDVPLSDIGRDQIHRLAGHPCLQAVDKILTSPLLRCTESAAILTANLKCRDAEVIPELAEINLGAWEGLTVAEVSKRFPGEYSARGKDLPGYRPDNGESFSDLLCRCWPVFQQATHCGIKHIAIVAHAGVNRVLLCKILGMPLNNLFELKQDYGCCNSILCDRSGYRIEYLNFRPAGPI